VRGDTVSAVTSFTGLRNITGAFGDIQFGIKLERTGISHLRSALLQSARTSIVPNDVSQCTEMTKRLSKRLASMLL
jgi:hypothetical protein